MPLLETPTDPGTAAWNDNQDVAAGSIATDAVTAAAAASQATTILTGTSADGATGAVTEASGASISVTGARVSGNVSVASGTSTTAGNNGDKVLNSSADVHVNSRSRIVRLHVRRAPPGASWVAFRCHASQPGPAGTRVGAIVAVSRKQ